MDHQNVSKNYYSLYIKYKMKYLNLKESNINLIEKNPERIINNKMKYLSLKENSLQKGGAVKKKDENITIDKGLKYAEKLVGIKYQVNELFTKTLHYK